MISQNPKSMGFIFSYFAILLILQRTNVHQIYHNPYLCGSNSKFAKPIEEGGGKVDICNKRKRVNTYISNRINS